MQSGKCDLKDIKEAVADGFNTLNVTLLQYAKNKENYDEQRDGHWRTTREQGNEIALIKREVCNMNSDLYSDDNKKKLGYYGIVGDLSILKSKMSETQSLIISLKEKTKEDMEELLKPISDNVDAIKERNLKKDAISNWKLSLPAGLLTILSIAQIIMFIIKG